MVQTRFGRFALQNWRFDANASNCVSIGTPLLFYTILTHFRTAVIGPRSAIFEVDFDVFRLFDEIRCNVVFLLYNHIDVLLSQSFNANKYRVNLEYYRLFTNI